VKAPKEVKRSWTSYNPAVIAFFRSVWVVVVAGSLTAGAAILVASDQTPAPQSQAPQFRGGTDIVPLDFLAYGPNGMPITDLTTKDVRLLVDGRAREIKTFQFVRLAATSAEVPAATRPIAPPFASNQGGRPGRSVVIVIDHEQLGVQESKPAKDAASAFIDRLTPADRVAVVTLPNGKVETDLTTNHARAKAALDQVVGRAIRTRGQWNISLNEALTVLAEVLDPDKVFTKELQERECRYADAESGYCRTYVVQEALRIARETQRKSLDTLQALKDFLEGLGSVEAPTAVLFISGTLVNFPETLPFMQDVARAASRGRVQMFVIQPHEPMVDLTARDQPPTAGLDADQRLTGLRDLAGVTGGEFVRLAGTGIPVFTRIANELSSHYLIGFEPRSGEQDGKPHKIQLEISRPGVTLRVRPTFIVDDPKRTPPSPMVLETLLRQTSTKRDLPLRTTAYVFRDNDPKQVKVVVALEPGEDAATLTSAAFALIDVQGKSAAQWTEEGANVVTRPLITAAAVPTGDYRLRVAAVDTAGRRGTVDYEFRADLLQSGPVSLGTLMAGALDRGNFRPSLIFAPGDQGAAGYLEFYGSFASGAELSARFELAAGADAPALVSAPGSVLGAAQATRFVATGAVSLAQLAPGDYVLRAVISVDNKPVATARRTIRRN
jgi:VWFA-related protein